MNECIHDVFVMNTDLLPPCSHRCLDVGRVDGGRLHEISQCLPSTKRCR